MGGGEAKNRFPVYSFFSGFFRDRAHLEECVVCAVLHEFRGGRD